MEITDNAIADAIGGKWKIALEQTDMFQFRREWQKVIASLGAMMDLVLFSGGSTSQAYNSLTVLIINAELQLYTFSPENH